jgi:hypothetical protein
VGHAVKLPENPQLPAQPDTAYLQDLVFQVQQIISQPEPADQRHQRRAHLGLPPTHRAFRLLMAPGNPGDFVAKATRRLWPGGRAVRAGWLALCGDGITSHAMGGSAGDVRVPPPTVPRRRSHVCPHAAPGPLRHRPYSQKIQAENATLHGITAVTTIAGYEGTGHADWFRSGFDEYLEFSFTGPDRSPAAT